MLCYFYNRYNVILIKDMVESDFVWRQLSIPATEIVQLTADQPPRLMNDDDAFAS